MTVKAYSGFALVAWLASHLVLPARADDAVELTIRNQGQGPLRCVAVLAHFVTRDFPPIGPGEEMRVALARQPESGGLALGRHEGHPMMLENILCGGLEDWSASYSDLPILPIRSGQARHYAFACRVEAKLLCRLTHKGE